MNDLERRRQAAARIAGSFEDGPPLDPDPLDVTPWDELREAATWAAAYDEGYEKGVLDGLPPFVVVALVGFTAALLGGMVGWAVGIAR